MAVQGPGQHVTGQDVASLLRLPVPSAHAAVQAGPQTLDAEVSPSHRYFQVGGLRFPPTCPLHPLPNWQSLKNLRRYPRLKGTN